MGKNILVMTGSPRKNGNSNQMAEVFIAGAESAGHHPTKYEAAFRKISGCRACDTCWSKGVPCSIQDDFNDTLFHLLGWADILVLCAPLYFYNFPSSLQAALEKIYSLLRENGANKMKITSAALLMCGGESDPGIFNGVVETYRRLCAGLHWEDLGMVLAPGILEKGAISGTGYLKQCEILGRNIES